MPRDFEKGLYTEDTPCWQSSIRSTMFETVFEEASAEISSREWFVHSGRPQGPFLQRSRAMRREDGET